MGKKFTNFLVVMAAMLLTIPVQAQVASRQARKAVSGPLRQVQIGEKAQKSKMASTAQKQKFLNKDVAGKSFQTFQAQEQVSPRRAAQESAVADEPMIVEKKPDSHFASRFMMTDMMRKTDNLSFRVMPFIGIPTGNHAPRRAATTDEHGIITDPDEGVSTQYWRSGNGFTVIQNTLYDNPQGGFVEIVETGDGTVYIKDILCGKLDDIWVRGTKESNKITIPTAQPMAWSSSYSTTISLYWGNKNGTSYAKDSSVNSITFTIDGDKISLDNSSEDRIIGMFWDDDNTWAGYGDYETVWTLDDGTWVENTDLITLPASATVEEWFGVGEGSAAVPANINVAFDGSDVYLGGLFADFPDSWVKGTRSGNTVTFSNLQYVGDKYDSNIWVVGATFGGDLKKSFTMTYDEEAGKLSLDENQLIIANASSVEMYYLAYYEALTIYKELPAPEQIDVLPYQNGFDDTTEQKSFSIIDANSDGSSWAFYSGMVRYKWNADNSGDDWLVSPAIKLVAGKKYHFSIDARAEGGYPERFEVKAAIERTADALSAGTEVIAPTEVGHSQFKTYETYEFEVAEDGYYFIGIHDISDADEFYLYVDNFLLEAAPLTPPYTADFSTEAAMGDFSVLDANEDESTWGWREDLGAYYHYNSSNSGDDYLILPIVLTAGKNYSVTVTAAAYSDWYAEKFEVVAGTTPGVFDINVIPETEVTSEDFEEYEGSITAETDGVYYVAIHATSDADMFYLLVSQFSIEEGADGGAPAAAPVFVATPGAEGALFVDVDYTVPLIAIDGSDLTGTVSAQIVRDNVVVAELTDLTPGTSGTWQDTNVEDGKDYTYYIVFSNEVGIGLKSAKQTVRVGSDDLADIENFLILEDSPSMISTSWSEAFGANGGYVNLANVDYTIYTIGFESFFGMTIPYADQPIASVKGENRLQVDMNTDEGEQTFLYLGVAASINGGPETDATANYDYMIVGAPYELPLEEGFADQTMHYVFDYNDNAGLGVIDDASDGDGVALALYPYNETGEVIFETGKLNIKNAANPTLLFDLKNYQGNTGSLSVYGIAPDKSTYELQTVTIPDEYTTIKVPLTSLLDKPGVSERFARVGIKANMTEDYDAATETDNSDIILIDNIKVVDLYQYDMSISVDAPKSLKAGERAMINATVKNEGENAANGYTVTIKAGEQTLLEQTVNESLAPFATSDFRAELATTIFDDAADVTIEATVTFDNDLNPDNDVATAIVSVKESNAPQPENVTAQDNSDGTINVSWSAPSSTAPEEYTEEFEDGLNDWKAVDSDGDGENWESFINGVSGDRNLSAHGGDGVVYSKSYNNDTGPLNPDNWLISPTAVLDGTFKFWAVGQDENYAAEHFAVFVSTESPTDLSTFVQVSEEFVATGEYTEYSVDLSSYAGQSGWIAIRHFNVTDMFYLVVDDITYLKSAGEATGYNIYVDGELVGNTSDTSFTTAEVPDGDHTVAVSAVYPGGVESKPVVVEVTTTDGIEMIVADGKPVDVYTLDGKLVRQQTTDFNGLRGIFVIGNKKVMIK